MYVTEESDDPNNPNGLIEHKLPWRSPSKPILSITDFLFIENATK